jgi:hypothetical protein
VDLIPENSVSLWSALGLGIPILPGIKQLEALNKEAIAIDALTLRQYHNICFWNLSRIRQLYCSTSATVSLNTIIACALGDRLEDSVEIALLPDAEVRLGYWRTAAEETGEVMEGGWTRYYEFILATW